MMIVKTALLALMLASGATVAGEAAAPAASTEATAKPASTEATAAAAKPAKAKTCENSSGTRIRQDPAKGCRTPVGLLRVYTQEDLQRTGETDLNQALRMLDPIFR
jgi:predicted flap endonuclease-1-like 5' DNA nuclease